MASIKPPPLGGFVELPECCRRYLDHALDLHAEWATEARRFLIAQPDWALTYLRSIAGLAQPGFNEMLVDIFLGKRPCPWHDGVPESYVAVMDAMKTAPTGRPQGGSNE